MVHHAGRKSAHKFDEHAEIGVILGPHPLTYGALRAYVFDSGTVVVRSEYTELKTLPSTFPFTIRKNTLDMTDIGLDSLTDNIATDTQEHIQTVLSKWAPPKAVPRRLKASTGSLTPTTTDVAHTAQTKRTLNTTTQSTAIHTPTVTESQTPVQAPGIAPSPTLSYTSSAAKRPRKRHAIEIPHLQNQGSSKKPKVSWEEKAYRSPKLRVSIDHTNSNKDTSRANSGTSVKTPTKTSSEPETVPSSNIFEKMLKGQTSGIPTTPANIPVPAPRSSGRVPRRVYSVQHTRLSKTLTAYKVSISSALAGDRAQESHEAIRDEILNMLTYKVGHYKHYYDIPVELRGNILHSFMFLKHKTKPDGAYDKTKLEW
jgi:hypothetical protein